MCLIYSNPTTAQTEFFHSKINFSETNFHEFYSLFRIDSNRIYFNATNYTLYAYDKNTKQLVWKDAQTYRHKEAYKKKGANRKS